MACLIYLLCVGTNIHATCILPEMEGLALFHLNLIEFSHLNVSFAPLPYKLRGPWVAENGPAGLIAQLGYGTVTMCLGHVIVVPGQHSAKWYSVVPGLARHGRMARLEIAPFFFFCNFNLLGLFCFSDDSPSRHCRV